MSNFWGIEQIAASASPVIVEVGASGLSGVLVGNESGLTVKVTLEGANTSRSLYPGTVDWFAIPPRSSFNGNISFTAVANLNNASSWPSSYVQIDTYGPGETPTGTYPMALPRNTNVGNSVTTNVTNSTLIFDGAVAGSQFIEAKAQGDATSGVTLDNSANLVLGNATHKGSITLAGTLSSDNGNVTTDGSGNLTVASFIADVGPIQTTGAGQNIQASGQLNSVVGRIALSSKVCVDFSGSDLSLITTVGNQGLLQVTGTGVIATWNASNFILSKTLKFANGGTIAGISAFSGTVTGTYNHNFGSTPAFVIMNTDVVGSQTTGYDSPNSTQVHCTTGAGLGFKGYCLG